MSVWYENFPHGKRPLICPACELPVQRMTHIDGSQTLRCPCGRTSMTILSGGTLDLGIVKDEPL